MAVVNDLYILQLDRIRENLRNILMDKGILKDKEATLEELVEAVKITNEKNSLSNLLSNELESITDDEILRLRPYSLYGLTTLTKAHFENLTYIAPSTFYNCTSLKNLYAPNVIEIDSGSPYYPFRNTQIENLIFPKAQVISSNGYYTFQTAKLKRLIIPKLTILPASPFASTNMLEVLDSSITGWNNKQVNLKTLIFRNTSKMPSLSSTDNLQNIEEIYCLNQFVEELKKATNWSVYADKIKPIEGSKYEDLDWYKNEEWYAEEMSVWE